MNPEITTPDKPEQAPIETLPSKPFWKSKFLWGFVGVSFLAAFIVGGIAIGRHQASQTSTAVSTSPTPTPTAISATNGKATQNPGWNLYQNTNYGFSFEYPQILTLLEDNLPTRVSPGGQTSVGESLRIYSSDHKNNLNAYMDLGGIDGICHSVYSYKAQQSGEKLSFAKTKEAPNPTAPDGANCSNFDEAMINFDNGNILTVDFEYTKSDADGQADFEKILNSFKFTNLDETANWKTYTSKSEGLSFKYPPSWKFTSFPCVNQAQEDAECAGLVSPEDKNSVPIVINYYFNDDNKDFAQTVESSSEISVPGSKKQLYFVTSTPTAYNSPNILIYDKKTTPGVKIPNILFTSQKDPAKLILFSAYLRKGAQNPVPYTIQEFQSHPNYNEAVKILKSISY